MEVNPKVSTAAEPTQTHVSLITMAACGYEFVFKEGNQEWKTMGHGQVERHIFREEHNNCNIIKLARNYE